jgi:nucleoside-diphosphate-sugar epimerase
MTASGPTLITGAGGFIGSRMVGWLNAQGVEAVGWLRDAMGDLRDEQRVTDVLRNIRPSRIIHLAAHPAGRPGDSWRVITQEQSMLTNLVTAMPSHCQIIYAGSMAEYGRSGYFDESDLCSPDTVYGCAKFCCTSLALSMRTTLELDVRVVRLFGVFGPGEGQSRLLPALIAQLEQGLPFDLSDGMQIRDFVHVDDTCAMIWAVANTPDIPMPIINVGTGIGVTVRHVCEVVADSMGVDRSLLRFGAAPRRTVDQDCLVAKVDRLSSIAIPPPQRWLDSSLAEDCVRAVRHFQHDIS